MLRISEVIKDSVERKGGNQGKKLGRRGMHKEKCKCSELGENYAGELLNC